MLNEMWQKIIVVGLLMIFILGIFIPNFPFDNALLVQMLAPLTILSGVILIIVIIRGDR